MKKIKRVDFLSCQTETDQDPVSLKRKRGRPRKLKSDLEDGQIIKVQSPTRRGKKIRFLNRNPNAILCWLIEKNMVLEGTKVQYRLLKRSTNLTEGRITRYGIECDCCLQIFGLSEFEAHAKSTRHRPAANIILEDGRSLTDCLAQLAETGEGMTSTRIPGRKNLEIEKVKQGNENASDGITSTRIPVRKNPGRKKVGRENKDASDSICSFCYDGGDLLICDQCPSVFHKNCLGVEEIPEENWSCPFCCCNNCGQNKLLNNDDQQEGFILSCDQCPRKFHVACARNIGVVKLERKSTEDTWFCSNKCEFVFSSLQQLLRKPIALGEDNLTWTLLKPMKPNRFDLGVSSANNRKLNLSLEVIHKCFEPVKEAYTGQDLVEDIVFSRGSNLSRLNFRGFYTVVLERNNELITVANVRISGNKVAEIPLVATKFGYRRQGMCRILMNELERQLTNLRVEKLVLPAADSTLETWTKSFGFSVMTDGDKKANSDYPVLVFQGTVLCQKFLERSILQDQSLDDPAVRGKLVDKS